MTHQEFNRLYDNGKIALKIYEGDIEGLHKTIEAFEYDGKFYLRIHKVSEPYTYERYDRYGRRHRTTRRSESHFIKEFDNRAYANNYFRKAAHGLKRSDRADME